MCEVAYYLYYYSICIVCANVLYVYRKQMLKFSTLYIEKCYGTALSVKFMLGLREMDKLLT